MPNAKGRDSLPKEIMESVRSRAYSEQDVAWFLDFIESNDATGAVKRAGFATKYPSWKGNQLVKKFQAEITDAVFTKRAASDGLAIKVLNDAMRTEHMVPMTLRDRDGNEAIATDPETGKPILVADPKILNVKIKAADSTLDRSPMPKGLAIHGQIPNLHNDGISNDHRAMLDDLVAEFGGGWEGALKVLQISKVFDHREYRDYLEAKYPPPKQINAAPESAGRPSEMN